MAVPDNFSSRSFQRASGPTGRRAWTADELRDVMLSDTAALLIEQTAMVLRLLPEVGRHWTNLGTLKSAIENLEFEASVLRGTAAQSRAGSTMTARPQREPDRAGRDVRPGVASPGN